MDNSPFAFPCEQHETQDGNWNQTFEPGMTLRDYFAAKLMASQLRIQQPPYRDYDYENAALRSYLMADAMLKVRNGMA